MKMALGMFKCCLYTQVQPVLCSLVLCTDRIASLGNFRNWLHRIPASRQSVIRVMRNKFSTKELALVIIF